MRRFGFSFFTVTAVLVIHSFSYASDVAEDEKRLADNDNRDFEVEKTSSQKQLKLFSSDGSEIGSDKEDFSKSVHENKDPKKTNEKVKLEKIQHESLPKVEDGFLLFNAMVMIGDELVDTWFNGQRCCDALKPLDLSVVAEGTGGVEVKINGHKMTMFPGDRVAIPRSKFGNTR